jgi:hypothetical protein
MLKPFVPERGSTGDPIPGLEVHFLDYPTRQDALALMLLEGERWNESSELRRSMMTTLGEQMAERNWQVYALRLATSAWMRQMTPEEEAARAGRKVSDYPDKIESMLVAGSTMDQRQRLVYCRIHRDRGGRVRTVDDWQHFPAEATLQFHLLQSAWQGYMLRYLELHNPVLLAQFERSQRERN